MGYKDRAALFPAKRAAESGRVTLAYNRMIVVDGRIVGSWRRSPAGSSVGIETDYIAPLNRSRLKAVAQAARRYLAFMEAAQE